MNNPSGITPVDMKVLVKPDEVEEVTKGGIIRPDTVRDKTKYAGTKATLVAIGPNAFKDWGSENGLSVGDRILFAQYSGAREKGADGKDYMIMNDQDVICRLDKEANV